MKDYEINALERAKADIKLFLVDPKELAIMSSPLKAEYLFFLTCYLEEKREIESQEEQRLLTNYLAPSFGTESFERKIMQSQENMKQYIRRLDKITLHIRSANRLEGKLEEIE